MWTLESSETVTEATKDKARQALDQLRNRDDLGFKNIQRMDEAIAQCEKHRGFLDDCTQIVVVGLGGSSLGTKALCQSLYGNNWLERVTFFDNVDASTVDEFLNQIEEPKDIGWVLCSKSGSTIEVLSLYDYCHEFLNKRHSYSISKKTLVVTEDKQSPLRQFADKYSCPSLTMPLDVGGRFSVFTPIGLYPLQILDFDSRKARQGFDEALNHSELIVELSSLLFSSQQKDERNFYSFQYTDSLNFWAAWLQQLWSESLAKDKTRSGRQAPVVSSFIPCRGTSDQHSVLQQIMEGHESKLVGFHRVLSSEKSQEKIKQSLFANSIMENKSIGDLMGYEMRATEQAIRESGTSTFVLTTDDLDEKSVAFLMGLWMMTVAVLGELFDINAFNQPGVEAGKRIAKQFLSDS